MTTNQEIIYQFLTGKGMTDAGAAAVLGNWQVESGWSPTAYNSGEHAIGLAQWEGGRRTNLQAFASRHGTTETDINAQLGYFWQEFTGPYRSVYTDLMTATDPAAAAADFDAHYEVSSGSARSQRMANAQSLYSDIKAGKLGKAGAGAAPAPLPDNAPYPPSTLKAPLTTEQRPKIAAWLTMEHLTHKVDQTYDPKWTDAQLLVHYKATLKLRGFIDTLPGLQNPKDALADGAPDWMKSLGTALGFLTQTKNWERIGLFVLGGVILLFAAVKMFTDSSMARMVP